jgi:Uma2 family endonuclease
VTSPSTEAYDRGAKLEHYRGLDGLREIVVVAHDQRRIELHRRGADGKWTALTAVDGQTLELESLGARLDVTAVYRALD